MSSESSTKQIPQSIEFPITVFTTIIAYPRPAQNSYIDWLCDRTTYTFYLRYSETIVKQRSVTHLFHRNQSITFDTTKPKKDATSNKEPVWQEFVELELGVQRVSACLILFQIQTKLDVNPIYYSVQTPDMTWPTWSLELELCQTGPKFQLLSSYYSWPMSSGH